MKFVFTLLLILICLICFSVLGKGIKTKCFFGTEVLYSTNIFNLSSRQISTLKENHASDSISGRFRDMDRIDDLVFIPDLSFNIGGPSFMKSEFEGELVCSYEFNTFNSELQHFSASLTLENSLGKRGNIALVGSGESQRFKRNYLVDAIARADSSVSRKNRIYQAAEYYQGELELEYKHRIITKAVSEKIRAQGILGLTTSRRRYNSSFHGRNQDRYGFFCGTRISFNKKQRLGLSYSFERIDCPRVKEILLLDEPIYKVDFNNDSDTFDNNIKSRRFVNRSYNVSSLDFDWRLILFEKYSLTFNYEFQGERYSSQEEYDGYHNRLDREHDIEFVFAWEINSRFNIVSLYAFEMQSKKSEWQSQFETDFITHTISCDIVVRLW